MVYPTPHSLLCHFRESDETNNRHLFKRESTDILSRGRYVSYVYPFDEILKISPLALALMAKHYYKKYSISIHVFSFPESPTSSKSLTAFFKVQFSKDSSPFGLILVHQRHTIGLLFQKCFYHGKWEIVVLDSMPRATFYDLFLSNFLQGLAKQFTLLAPREDTQLTLISCKVLALIQLRNALLAFTQRPACVREKSSFHWTVVNQAPIVADESMNPRISSKPDKPRETCRVTRARYTTDVIRRVEEGDGSHYSEVKKLSAYAQVKAYRIRDTLSRLYSGKPHEVLLAAASEFLTEIL